MPRLLEVGAQGVARLSRFASLACNRRSSPSSAVKLVLGDGTELRHAAALAGVEADALGPATTVLVRLDLLRCEDPLEFFHPVVRRAVYETLDVVERDAAHRRAAELLLDAGNARERGRAPPPRGTPGRLVRGLDTPPGGGALTRSGRS